MLFILTRESNYINRRTTNNYALIIQESNLLHNRLSGVCGLVSAKMFDLTKDSFKNRTPLKKTLKETDMLIFYQGLKIPLIKKY
jgi:hypothetical protein